MPLHLSSSPKISQESLREARRLLASQVRHNWSYPCLAQYATTPADLDPEADAHTTDTSPNTSEAQATHLALHTPADQDLPQQIPDAQVKVEVLAWREREYSEDDDDSEGAVAAMGAYKLHGRRSTGLATREQEAQSRKRKRARALEQEMGWNDGLAHFVARRNAWTCARETGDVVGSGGARRSGGTLATSRRTGTATTDLDVDMRTPEPEEPTEEEEVEEDDDEDEQVPHTAQPCLSDIGVLLPIPQPLLPDHPIRKKISPNTYGEIYSKIILQARTPTIPINLSDITNALIHGWKEEGNWPPKGNVVEPPIGRRRRSITEAVSQRHPNLKKGVQAVGRVLGIGVNGTS